MRTVHRHPSAGKRDGHISQCEREESSCLVTIANRVSLKTCTDELNTSACARYPQTSIYETFPRQAANVVSRREREPKFIRRYKPNGCNGPPSNKPWYLLQRFRL
ncbi:hypothetical protein SCLCIDRAFT_1117254 [Scleroderma citrinum Foug A]|uniref:Uncharacterized protein n=1 Tax=Scleroderma citrinum Foug A TaxID=1036808 RepID=A0A0C3DNJ5_9AGAM|nr:hypothetical protein SCLCIDRAFT_1117254 [Scleroderma citrinum Foug A]